MNPILLQPNNKQEQKVMVLLGLNGETPNFTSTSLPEENPFRLREFQSSYLAFRWLEARLDKPNKIQEIQAIICGYEFLETEDFMLIRAIQEHDCLREIPFISLYQNEMPNAAKLLKLGIDDCFQIPVNNEALETRINFLKTFKKQKQVHKAKPDDILAPKLPWKKRLFDITFASAALLAASPILLISALAIKLTDGGDITYTSKRVGTGYNIFDFLKLRSMYADADQRLEEMKKLNQYEEGSVFQKFANDPRVTPIGKIIRKFSIDELPQLVNVIKGDMSIVGNRPLPLYEAQELTRDDWARRFLAPAGITGLWQVSKRGKNDMSMQERIDLDISYANNWSFWYDIKLILRTPFSIVQSSDV